MLNATRISKRSSTEIQAIRHRDPILPLKPLVPECKWYGDFPRWFSAVEVVAPELVSRARKEGR